MKWEVKVSKNGKKYIRVDGNSLLCMLYNTTTGELVTPIEDALTEQIVAAVNRKPLITLSHMHIYDYNRENVLAMIQQAEKDPDMKKIIQGLAERRRPLRIEIYEEEL